MDIEQTLVPYMESRTDFYKTLHKLYRWPLSQEEFDALDGEGFKVLSEQLEDGLMAAGFNDMYRFLRRRNTGTRQVLSADFTRVFLGTVTYEGFSAQPYASLFVGDGHQLMGAERTAVNKVYRAHAVRLSKGIDLPEDHLAFECEFLSIINQRAVDALRAGEYGRAVDLLKVEKHFLEEHVLNWVPRFYALANKLVETRFYRGLLRVTKGYLVDEPQVIDDLIADIQDAARDQSLQ